MFCALFVHNYDFTTVKIFQIDKILRKCYTNLEIIPQKQIVMSQKCKCGLHFSLRLQNLHIYLLFLVESLDVFSKHDMREFDINNENACVMIEKEVYNETLEK